MTVTYKVEGMTCGGCASAVTKALEALPGSASVSVDLESKSVSVQGLEDDSLVGQAIEDAGFDFLGRLPS